MRATASSLARGHFPTGRTSIGSRGAAAATTRSTALLKASVADGRRSQAEAPPLVAPAPSMEGALISTGGTAWTCPHVFLLYRGSLTVPLPPRRALSGAWSLGTASNGMTGVATLSTACLRWREAGPCSTAKAQSRDASTAVNAVRPFPWGTHRLPVATLEGGKAGWRGGGGDQKGIPSLFDCGTLFLRTPLPHSRRPRQSEVKRLSVRRPQHTFARGHLGLLGNVEWWAPQPHRGAHR